MRISQVFSPLLKNYFPVYYTFTIGKIAVFLLFLFYFNDASSQCFTILDQFNSQAYNLNNGNKNWASAWVELGETTNATTGNVRIDASRGFLKINNAVFGASRTANLSTACSAILTFDFESVENGNDYFVVEASSNGGTSYTLLETINPVGSTGNETLRNVSKSYILKDFISLTANVVIRFKVSAGYNTANGQYTAVDNVKIEYCESPPTIASTTPVSRCGTGTVSLGASASAGTINWYAASTGGSSLGTGTSFTTPSISSTTTYWVDATNNGCTTASRTSVVATVNAIPTISGTTPGSRCGTGTVSLGASASAGTINWYAASTGGASLGTGTGFTTPSISSTTTYWVDATNNGCTTASRTAVLATVNTTPTITGPTPGIRLGTGTVVLGATASAGTINWYTTSTGGSSIGSGTSFTTPSISATTSFWVDATNGSCITGSRTEVIATVSTLNGTQNIVCQNEVVTYSLNNSFDTYQWTVVGGTPASGTSSTITVTWGTGNRGQVTVEGFKGGISAGTVTRRIYIDQKSVFTATPDTNICNGDTATLSLTFENKSLKFNGSTDYVGISNSNLINLGTTNFRTVSLWFKANDVNTKQVLYNEGGAINGFSMYIEGGKIYVLAWENNTAWNAPNTTIITGEWYNLTFVFDKDATDGTHFKGYLNGLSIGSFNEGSKANDGMNSHSGPVALGSNSSIRFHDNSISANNYFNGYIDDFKLWNRALSNDEIIIEKSHWLTNPVLDAALDVYINFNNSVLDLSDSPSSEDGALYGSPNYDNDAALLPGILWSPGGSTNSSISVSPSVSTTYSYILTEKLSGICSLNGTINVTVTPIPNIAGTTPASNCGTGTVTLGANASAGTINWYAASTGGPSLGTGTSFITPSISSTTTYWVDATNTCGTTASRTAVIATITKNNWSGVNTDWNDPANWCAGVPTIGVPNTLDVLIPTGLTNYPIIYAGDPAGYVKTIVLEINTTLNIQDNSLLVTDNLKLDGKIDLEGESQLLQDIGSILDPTSSGTLERDQQGTADKYTYNYWSSPVNSINNNSYKLPDVIKNIGFLTSGYDGTAIPLRIADYWIWKFSNLTSGDYSKWEHVRSTGTLLAGEGFTMKGPGTGSIPALQNYVFEGKPNNGDIELNISAGNEYLVGNPYPSALDADQFILDNGLTIAGPGSTTGTLYFWEHWGGGSHLLSEYQGGYATYSLSGGVPSASLGTNDPLVATGGTPTKIPGRYIPVAQGFFVTAENSGTIKFNNGQRVFQVEDGTSSLFIKQLNSKTNKNAVSDTRTKLRLSFNSVNAIKRQLLVTVDSNSSINYDWGYDAPYIENLKDDAYWMIDNKKYTIQGIDKIYESTVIPLGIHTKNEGWNTFSIDAIENDDNNLDVFLHDKTLNTYHNLKESSFKIYIPAGEYLNRFELTFNNNESLLTTNDVINKDIELYFSNEKQSIIINNPNYKAIKSVNIINILGQVITDFNINSTNNFLELKTKNITIGTYIITLQTDKDMISKKVIIN